MALIQCPECGEMISDAAKDCPKCGYPISNNMINTGVSQSCPKCGSANISFSVEQIQQRNKGRAEVRKKSPLTRMGNSLGRATLVMLTAGLWLLVPKKSKYSEISKGKTKIKNITYGVCQDCGYSWKR